ncbi:MAG TPA: multicopper oxidase domain-containing protein [Hyphomicrobiaceae bacterium]|nr:multicopper oxidase domain-containing protein [Hyphomicrobiaceae bacterium]
MARPALSRRVGRARHQVVQPGATWRPRLKIDQPAATLWYHAHRHRAMARQFTRG